MRILLLAALLMALPTAAAHNLPVAHVVEVTAPSEGCPDCVGVTAGAGAWVPCLDCPGWGALVEAEMAGGEPEARIRVCQTGFVYECYVDQRV